MATLSAEAYRDKVYACWMGKNCGGTLGAPLEKVYGQQEPFHIDWYPELRAGGIPNDDLEMQLIWLKAVEERGFALTAQDLAQYWLDYIGYNWDEYGLNKTNLRLGLLPPVSGYFNNWFRDCMGSPIRSEIWACLAPGNPNLAVRFAYEDAIVDHAGGEGLWGEVFNTALQAAAFVETDPQTLLDLALGYIPATSETYKAVQAARQACRDGLSWQQARQQVMQTTPHYVAQYAPLNMGFQTIGWLYGRDFGDALCTAVNCGYDTDCTGATLGALLGILGGRASLPTRWTAPLGDSIATNESWGGLRHASTGSNPIPTTLEELTERVCLQGRRLLASRGAALQIGEQTDLHGLTGCHLSVTEETKQGLQQSPLQLMHQLNSLTVDIRYQKAPVIAPNEDCVVEVELHNPHPTDLITTILLRLPEGWEVTSSQPESLHLAAYDSLQLSYTFSAPNPTCIRNTNTIELQVQPQQRPAEPAIPLVVLGARRWQMCYDEAGGEEKDTGIERAWSIQAAPENALPVPQDWVGTLYARLWLWNPVERDALLGVPATCPRTLRVNGRLIREVSEGSLLRPNYGGDGISYGNAWLKYGWNEVLITYTRAPGDPAFAAHFTLATPGLFHGISDIEWTHFPWEEENATL